MPPRRRCGIWGVGHGDIRGRSDYIPLMVRWDVERSPMSVQLLTGLGADHGLSAQTCLRGTGLRPADLRHPEATFSAKQELTVIENLLEALPDRPGLGLEAGVRYHLTTYGIWGFALISSPTLRSAFDIGLRFLDLTFAFTRIHARDRGHEWHMVLDAPDVPPALRRFVVERDSAAIRIIQQEAFAAPVPIREIRYAFPAPADVAPYAEVFGVEPVFDATENAVGIDPAVLDVALPQHNEHTAAIAEEQCRQLLAKRQARTGLSGQVRDLLFARPAQPPALDEVATALHLSERTLRRRLAEEQVSYRALIDEFREQLAEELLVGGGLRVAEVAQRLGYVEVSSFSQAFRRWKGVGPREYRARVAVR